MYKLLKKTVCVLLIVALFAGIALEASAVEGPSMDEAFDEYFTFAGKQRIDNNGSFEFNFRSELRSEQKFTVSKSNVEITAKCRVYNVNTGSLTKDSEKSFTLTVYDAATGTAVDSFDGFANNKNAKGNFTLTTGHEYYFVITCSPTFAMPYSLKGSGTISSLDKVVAWR